MDAPTIIPPGGGEVIGDSVDRRVEILCEHDGLHATWSRFGPRRDGADLHVHRRHTDLFYVLEGVLTVRLGPGGDPVGVPAGRLARVPALVVHGFRNGSDDEVRYLNFHAPGQGFAGYLRSLREGDPVVYDQEPPPADGGRDAAEAVFGRPEAMAGGVALLADEPEIAIAEVAGEPEALEPALRADPDHPVWVFVLDGELAVGDDEPRAGAGSWVQVPAGAHQRISSSRSARVLVVHAPGGSLRAALTPVPAQARAPGSGSRSS